MIRTLTVLLAFSLILLSCESANVKADIEILPEKVEQTPSVDTIIEVQEKDPTIVIKNGPKTCLELVTLILESSPKFKAKTKGLNKAIIANGGTSYGIMLERSPNPGKEFSLEYSENYDFNLHESYPDRMQVIDRFSYSPSKQLLYYYDVIEDEMISIDFDRSYLNYSELCR